MQPLAPLPAGPLAPLPAAQPFAPQPFADPHAPADAIRFYDRVLEASDRKLARLNTLGSKAKSEGYRHLVRSVRHHAFCLKMNCQLALPPIFVGDSLVASLGLPDFWADLCAGSPAQQPAQQPAPGLPAGPSPMDTDAIFDPLSSSIWSPSVESFGPFQPSLRMLELPAPQAFQQQQQPQHAQQQPPPQQQQPSPASAFAASVFGALSSMPFDLTLSLTPMPALASASAGPLSAPAPSFSSLPSMPSMPSMPPFVPPQLPQTQAPTAPTSPSTPLQPAAPALQHVLSPMAPVQPPAAAAPGQTMQLLAPVPSIQIHPAPAPMQAQATSPPGPSPSHAAPPPPLTLSLAPLPAGSQQQPQQQQGLMLQPTSPTLEPPSPIFAPVSPTQPQAAPQPLLLSSVQPAAPAGSGISGGPLASSNSPAQVAPGSLQITIPQGTAAADAAAAVAAAAAAVAAAAGAAAAASHSLPQDPPEGVMPEVPPTVLVEHHTSIIQESSLVRPLSPDAYHPRRGSPLKDAMADLRKSPSPPTGQQPMPNDVEFMACTDDPAPAKPAEMPCDMSCDPDSHDAAPLESATPPAAPSAHPRSAPRRSQSSHSLRKRRSLRRRSSSVEGGKSAAVDDSPPSAQPSGRMVSGSHRVSASTEPSETAASLQASSATIALASQASSHALLPAISSTISSASPSLGLSSTKTPSPQELPSSMAQQHPQAHMFSHREHDEEPVFSMARTQASVLTSMLSPTTATIGTTSSARHVIVFDDEPEDDDDDDDGVSGSAHSRLVTRRIGARRSTRRQASLLPVPTVSQGPIASAPPGGACASCSALMAQGNASSSSLATSAVTTSDCATSACSSSSADASDASDPEYGAPTTRRRTRSATSARIPAAPGDDCDAMVVDSDRLGAGDLVPAFRTRKSSRRSGQRAPRRHVVQQQQHQCPNCHHHRHASGGHSTSPPPVTSQKHQQHAGSSISIPPSTTSPVHKHNLRSTARTGAAALAAVHALSQGLAGVAVPLSPAASAKRHRNDFALTAAVALKSGGRLTRSAAAAAVAAAAPIAPAAAAESAYPSPPEPSSNQAL
ncbi:hypothetical protein HK105_206830 [Polyrhizophydium stewartii]|uniref:Uncharacterized protein n=1 Tax=Polyrhizophydium stewartii TaxID=2732419 RepID=A0ABR4N2C9_9FUNG